MAVSGRPARADQELEGVSIYPPSNRHCHCSLVCKETRENRSLQRLVIKLHKKTISV